MGIDFAIGRVQEAVMLDERSQAFCSSNNRWFSNQLPDQHYLTMNTVEPFEGHNSPMGLPPAGPSPGFGNHEGNLLLSTSPSDTFDDLNRPAMDNGYGICQSPGWESIYSNRTNLGTPNSYINDCPADSPRERLFSTSSSTYTYSPYNAHEEINCTPTIQRQASLEMVEEFFNRSPGVTACTDDTGLLDTSSQGFATHCISNTDFAAQQNLLQPDEFLTNPVNIFSFEGMIKLDGSPQNDSTQTSNSGEDNTGTTLSNSNSTPVFASSNGDSIPLSTVNSDANPLLRQYSTLSELINETIAPNSQDALMVSDCVKSFDENALFPTVNVEIVTLGPHSPEAQPSPQNSNTPIQSITKPVKLQTEEDMGISRRERNNAACRASRKRRKDKKTELENSVGTLEEENRTLQTQIEHLELECKRFKEEIFSRMGNTSR